MRLKSWGLYVLLLVTVGASSALPTVARAVPLGTLSFDSFIPGPDGINAFNLSNFTGDHLIGGFALPPDFPVLDSLTFTNSSLTVTFGDSTTSIINLGDIFPGPLLDLFGAPLAVLQFPDTTEFLSATFASTLSQTSFLLSDGTTFFVSSAFLSTTLIPSSGRTLLAGAELAVIDAAGAAGTPVPEPASLLLLASGFALPYLWAWRRKVAPYP